MLKVSEGKAPIAGWSQVLLDPRAQRSFLRINGCLLLQHELPRAHLRSFENGETKQSSVSLAGSPTVCPWHWNLNVISMHQCSPVSREEQRRTHKDHMGALADSASRV